MKNNYRYCSICGDKIFKFIKKKADFYSKYFRIPTFEEKTIKDWLSYHETYICKECYNKILNDNRR